MTDIIKSECVCGQKVLIQQSGSKTRCDGKRVFYPDVQDTGWDAFRCKSCHSPVSESVPGAQYGEPTKGVGCADG